jgi:hypothetical protein
MAPDMYHTHYVLSGLSVGQHKPRHSRDEIRKLTDHFQTPDFATCMLGATEREDEALQRMKGVYARTLGWEFYPRDKLIVGRPENEVVGVPVYCRVPSFFSLFIVVVLNLLFLFLYAGIRQSGSECQALRRSTSDELFLSSGVVSFSCAT